MNPVGDLAAVLILFFLGFLLIWAGVMLTRVFVYVREWVRARVFHRSSHAKPVRRHTARFKEYRRDIVA